MTARKKTVRDLHGPFLAGLSAAQKWRSSRVDWVLYERQTMRNLVNVERTAMGLPVVTLADVERVETQAEGHSDYSSKFALYCAELALGLDFGP